MSKVIFDGECPVCASLKDFTEDRIEDRELAFIPYQSDDFEQSAPNLTMEDAKKALYVITEHGERLRGARAVFEIMSELPGISGIMGKILRLPPFYWIAEPFYRLFAKHRHGVSKFLQD